MGFDRVDPIDEILKFLFGATTRNLPVSEDDCACKFEFGTAEIAEFCYHPIEVVSMLFEEFSTHVLQQTRPPGWGDSVYKWA